MLLTGKQTNKPTLAETQPLWPEVIVDIGHSRYVVTHRTCLLATFLCTAHLTFTGIMHIVEWGIH